MTIWIIKMPISSANEVLEKKASALDCQKERLKTEMETLDPKTEVL